jgi:hypothetical protein
MDLFLFNYRIKIDAKEKKRNINRNKIAVVHRP